MAFVKEGLIVVGLAVHCACRLSEPSQARQMRGSPHIGAAHCLPNLTISATFSPIGLEECKMSPHAFLCTSNGSPQIGYR